MLRTFLACSFLLSPCAAAASDASKSPLSEAEHYYRLGDEAKALSFLDRAVRSAPEDPSVRLLRAKVLSRLGRHAEAEQEARLCVRLDPDGAEGPLAAAWSLLHLERPDEAVVWATRAADLSPKLPEAYVVRAFAYERMRELGKMQSDLLAAASLAPERYAGHLRASMTGRTLFDPKDPESWRSLEPLDYDPLAFLRRPAVLAAFALAVLCGAGFWLYRRLRRGRETEAAEPAAPDGRGT